MKIVALLLKLIIHKIYCNELIEISLKENQK